jgi:2-polyprenyl-6-methoxyphenol hydroxylase-like FAD-dependent oxidoreductase
MLDALIVGAGPTGLSLAALLRAVGASVRIVDRQHDRVHESRALAVQPRTLEVLRAVGLAETLVDRLQAMADAFSGGGLRLRDPVWITDFRIRHQQAAHYRAGRVFVAGDAAHVHSPAGAQGMNTGIQDAWNLGWKLWLVASGVAGDALLDSYQAERWPVGRFVLRFTDRAFRVSTSDNPSCA